VDRDLISPFPFPIVKEPKLYAADLAAAERTVPPVFRRRDQAYDESADSLRKVWNDILIEIQRRRGAAGGTGGASRLPFRLTGPEWDALAGIDRSTKGGLKSILEAREGEILGI